MGLWHVCPVDDQQELPRGDDARPWLVLHLNAYESVLFVACGLEPVYGRRRNAPNRASESMVEGPAHLEEQYHLTYEVFH
jgi:hypothetical protein